MYVTTEQLFWETILVFPNINYLTILLSNIPLPHSTCFECIKNDFVYICFVNAKPCAPNLYNQSY